MLNFLCQRNTQMSDYGDPNYWENRYRETEGKTFDWLEGYDAVRPFIQKHFSTK